MDDDGFRWCVVVEGEADVSGGGDDFVAAGFGVGGEEKLEGVVVGLPDVYGGTGEGSNAVDGIGVAAAGEDGDG